MFTSIEYEKFRTLRITHVATRFEELIADEANDELTPEQLFLTAIDDALEQRRANRIAALIRKAGFPIPTATIAELDYREGRGINPTRMRRYAAHDWSAEPVNLLINSPAGGGKTYLACAIGIAACQNQHDVAYTRMDELARKLVIARGDAIAHQRLLNELSDTDLLIIDLSGVLSHTSVTSPAWAGRLFPDVGVSLSKVPHQRRRRRHDERAWGCSVSCLMGSGPER